LGPDLPRQCACGCGKPVTGERLYFSDAHKQRAYRARTVSPTGSSYNEYRRLAAMGKLHDEDVPYRALF
jgi:hypothetical protein